MNTYPVWVGDFANTVPEKILREQNHKITEAGGAPGSSLLAAGQGEQAPQNQGFESWARVWRSWQNRAVLWKMGCARSVLWDCISWSGESTAH